MNKAVRFENVGFSYPGGETIIENSDFRLDYGEISLLAGASGAGKSTVLSLICGIIPNLTPGEMSGNILINGENIQGRPLREICREVGVVLQNADSQIIQQFVEDEIAFGCENFNFPPDVIKERIDFSCNQMLLDPGWETHTLSGGQKQRLITASTLATDQKIILLDEPLANLDIQGADSLMRSLKALTENGYAVLIVEHRIDMIIKYADRVWVLDDKQIKKIENVREYLNNLSDIISDTSQSTVPGDNLISLKNISYKVKDRVILNDLSLDIQKGERLLLLGENGCGKTTLLRIIARLQKPSSGEMSQNIVPNPKRTKQWFRKVGVVYQNPNYQLFMPTVEEEVSYNADSPEYAENILNLFDLEPIRDKHPQSLSEGQKRRLTIAAVLAGKPDLLLLDEPTVGQDFEGLRKMTDILNEIHTKTGNTMITVTHDKRCAEALCERAVIIENGSIFKSGGKDTAHNYLFNDLHERKQDDNEKHN